MLRRIICFYLYMAIIAVGAGCSKPTETDNIPIPEDINQADPLIKELFNRSAAEIKADPMNSNAWALHASALLANAYYRESVAASKIALSLSDEKRLPLHYRQSIAMWRLNMQEEAIAEMKKVLKAEATYDMGWRTLASWHLERGEIIEAEMAIFKANELSPNRPGTLSTYVQILLQKEKPELAIAALEPRLNQENTPPHLYFLASQAYRQMGKLDLMEVAASQGQPVPKLWPDPWLNEIALLATGKRMLASNALALLRTRGPKAAQPYLIKALDADVGNMQIRIALSMSYLVTQNFSEAREVLELHDNKEDVGEDYWAAFGNIALEQSKLSDRELFLQEAWAYFKKAEDASGGSLKLYVSIARLAVAMNNLDEAARCYRLGADFLINEAKLQEAMQLLREGIKNIPDDSTLKAMLEDITRDQ